MLSFIAFICIITHKCRADLAISSELYNSLGVNPEISFCSGYYMNRFCNFGIPSYISDTFSQSAFYFSECNLDCFSKDCDISLLNNANCDESCNFPECGWDGGDCGVCSTGCTVEMLSNSICDDLCNTPECMFDMFTCAPICGKNCSVYLLDLPTCQKECN